MSLSFNRRVAALLALALVLPLAATPAFADKKGIKPLQGLSGIVKMHDNVCEEIHMDLVSAEGDADTYAGTVKGLGAEAKADNAWQKGVDNGCAWAS